jgi:hypothetical protein
MAEKIFLRENEERQTLERENHERKTNIRNYFCILIWVAFLFANFLNLSVTSFFILRDIDVIFTLRPHSVIRVGACPIM